MRRVLATFLVALLVLQGAIAQAPDKRKRADELFEQGRLLVEVVKAVELRSGIAKLREARKLYAELGSREEEAFCLSQIGNAHRYLGEFREAIDAWNESLAL